MALALLWAVESGVGTSAPLMTPARIMASRSALTTSVLSVANRLWRSSAGAFAPVESFLILTSRRFMIYDSLLRLRSYWVGCWIKPLRYLMIDFWTISTCKSHVGRISARRKGPTPQVSPLSWLRVVMF